MKGRINKTGTLSIFRCDEWREQGCPFHKHVRHCGDWCPLFGEPKSYVGGYAEWEISICHNKTLYLDEFEDLRPEV